MGRAVKVGAARDALNHDIFWIFFGYFLHYFCIFCTSGVYYFIFIAFFCIFFVFYAFFCIFIHIFAYFCILCILCTFFAHCARVFSA